ncbi:hypothetical protein BAZSYMB_SCAFFOLD00101_4 [Bathymodiolus azoricus thioautotrophic gill symbiont]|uniref:Uncharacterized protein n=1 Tax=Bathymodiolus azoricus thioautotrophic gill symbiont TaxID=235205 RepID=A0A1H6LUC9_9GAMM|nr:hypothetical protein BAZSYMB_SCAFFOLD00101_4 [Bathymodiolus azoricus thioautotrophic gill symbiont]
MQKSLFSMVCLTHLRRLKVLAVNGIVIFSQHLGLLNIGKNNAVLVIITQYLLFE